MEILNSLVASISKKHAVLVLLLISLSLRSVYLIFSPQTKSIEHRCYDDAAINMLEGRGLVYPLPPSPIWKNVPAELHALFPPAYPLLTAGCFAVFGRSRLPIYTLQAIMDSLTAVLLFMIAHVLWGPAAGLWAGGLYAGYMEPIFFINTMTPFTLCTFLLALAVLISVQELPAPIRPWKPFLIGALTGGLSLCRSEFMLLFPVFAWREFRAAPRPIRAAGFFALGFLVSYGPWVIRNYLVLGEWVFGSTNGPLNYYIVALNFAKRWGRPNNLTFEPLPVGTTEISYLAPLSQKLLGFYASLTLKEWLSLMGWGMIQWLFPFHADSSYNLTFGLVTPFALSGAWMLRRHKHWDLLLLPVFALSALYVPMMIGTPYREVFAPLWILWAAFAVDRLWSRFGAWRRARPALTGVWVVGHCFIYFYLDALKPFIKAAIHWK